MNKRVKPEPVYLLSEARVRAILARAKQEEKEKPYYAAFYGGFIAGLEVALDEARLPWE